jgi:hypothetical protein
MLWGLFGIRLKSEFVRRNSLGEHSLNLSLVRSFYLRDGSTNSIFRFGSTSGPSRASASIPKYGAIMHMYECIEVQ